MSEQRARIYTRRNSGLCLKLENVVVQAFTAGRIAAQEFVEPTFSMAHNLEVAYPVVKVFCPTPRFREALELLKPETMPSDLKWIVMNFDCLEGATAAEARQQACEIACTILDISFPNEVFLIEPCTPQPSIMNRQPEKARFSLDDLY